MIEQILFLHKLISSKKSEVTLHTIIFKVFERQKSDLYLKFHDSMGRFLDEGGALNQEWTLTQGNKVLDLITCS